MNLLCSLCSSLLVASILTATFGCDNNKGKQRGNGIEANVQSLSSRDKKVDPPNELGFSKMSNRDGDIYQEGIVDAQGNEIIRLRSDLLVNDICSRLALVQLDRKFLFVPLDQGSISEDDMDSVNGFQYAEPYCCGLAMVKVNDVWFYIDSNGDKAFDSDFEFAESFHHDLAYVKASNRHRIIDTHGKTVADLNYDQVSPQSPWCWQVTSIEQEKA